MASKSLVRPTHTLYDEDFALWIAKTAQLLRVRRFDEIDVEHLVEEIEAMAGRDRRELENRLAVLIKHLLKWEHQATRRSGSWQSTIITQRGALEGILEQSPSLRRTVPAVVARAYHLAAAAAAAESRLPADTFPRECPYSPEQILDDTFLPRR